MLSTEAPTSDKIITGSINTYDLSLLDHLPNPVLLLGRDYRLLAANSAWRHLGGSLDNPSDWLSYFSIDARQRMQDHLRSNADGECILRSTSGHIYHAAVSSWPAQEAALLLTLTDVSVLHEELARSNQQTKELIRRASEIITSTPDYQSALEGLVRLCVPTLADISILDMVTPAEKLERLAVGATDKSRENILLQLGKEYPGVISNPSHGYLHATKTSKPDYIENADELFETHARSPEHLALIRKLKIKSAVVFPLSIHGKSIGMLTLAVADSGRRFSVQELSVAEEISHLLAIALDNAMLYTAAQTELSEHTATQDLAFKLTTQIERERARLRTLVSRVPGVVWEAYGKPDLQSQRIDFVSDHVEEMLGYSTEEWLSTPNFWLQIVHPEDRERAATEAAAIFNSRKGGVSEFRWIAKDGRVLWVEARSTVILDEAGNPIGQRGVTYDITERRSLATNLQEQEQLLRLIITNVPALVAYIDKDLCYRLNNQHHTDWYLPGAPSLQTNPKVLDVIGQEAYDAVLPYMQNVLRGNPTRFETALPTQAGEFYIRASYVPHFNEEHEVEGFIALVQDITKEKSAERERIELIENERKSSQTLSDLLETIHESFITVDSEFRCTYVNKRGAEFVGKNASDLYGRVIWDAYSLIGPEYREHLIKVMQHRVTAQFENYSEQFDRWYQTDIYPSEDGATIIERDITNRKKLESALKASESQLKLVMNSVPAMIAHVDTSLRFQFVNKAFEEWLGKPLEEIVGKTYEEILGKENFDHSNTHFKQVFAGKQVTLETSSVDSTGALRTYSVTYSPNRTESGAINGFISLRRDISENKKNEEALRRSEAQWRRLVESNPIGVVLEDFDGRILEANDNYLQMIGYTRDDLAKGVLRWDTITPEKYRERDQQAIEEVRRTRRFHSYEKEYIRKDGERVSIFIGGAMLEGAGDQVVSFVLDISERKRTELELQESEDRFRAMFEQAAVGIARFELDGTWSKVNQKLCEITGFTAEELYQRTFIDITDPLDIAQDIREVARLQDGEIHSYSVEKRFMRKDGESIWVKITPSLLRNAEGEPQYYIAIIEDINEQKAAEQEKQLVSERFSAVTNTAPALIWFSDTDGQRIFFNRMWLEYTGEALENQLGEGWKEMLHPEDRERYISAYERAHRTQQDMREEYRLRHQHLGYRWILASAVPRFDDQGVFLGMIGSCIDIEERKHAEEELKNAKEAAEAASKAKDHFLAVLSHELRTPLTPVMTTIETLELDDTVPASMRPFLATIRRNIELEARLINDLLDLTRITRGKLELQLRTVDLHATILSVLEICRAEIEKKQLKLSIKLQANKYFVQGDSARLQQVLWNLIHNAVKFTPAHGTLQVTSEMQNGRIAIHIIDSGIGIASEVLPSIFDPFEQGDYTITKQFGGLGLGLAISKNLVSLHNGVLSAASAGKDQGSTFTLMFEVTEPTIQEEIRSALTSETVTASGKKKILLVDDHIDTGNALRMLLERRGYEVSTASSVESAFGLAIGSDFNLLISDIGLPDGTGHDLIQKISSVQPVKAIALSGFGTDQDIQKSKDAGFIAHFTKPFSFPQLEKMIKEILE